MEKTDRLSNYLAISKIQEKVYYRNPIDVNNPSGADVSIKIIEFISNKSAYFAKPGPNIHPKEGNYEFPPVAQAKSTTTIPLLPSGYSGNPTNTFPKNSRVMITIGIVGTKT